MLTVLMAEALKLRRSLVLLVVAVAPASVALIATAALLTRSDGVRWERYLDEGLAMWSFFMLPLAVTALALLLAQLEHGARMWGHLFTQPTGRATQILAKLAVGFASLLAMQAIMPLGMFTGGFAVDAAFGGTKLIGDTQIDDMARGMGWMTLGALPLLVLQLWLAIVVRSFIAPLAVGIVGTFVVLVSTAAGVDMYLPWGLPVYATMWPKAAGVIGVYGGIAGGAIATTAMLFDLSRRELA